MSVSCHKLMFSGTVNTQAQTTDGKYSICNILYTQIMITALVE